MAIGRIAGIRATTSIKRVKRSAGVNPAPGELLLLRGVVLNVELERNRFVLKQDDKTQTVQWCRDTEFSGLSPATLSGNTVRVIGRKRLEGIMASSVVVA